MAAECDCDSLLYFIADAACDDTNVYVFGVEAGSCRREPEKVKREDSIFKIFTECVNIRVIKLMERHR